MSQSKPCTFIRARPFGGFVCRSCDASEDRSDHVEHTRRGMLNHLLHHYELGHYVQPASWHIAINEGYDAGQVA